MTLVRVASPMPSATMNTTGASLTATPIHAGVPLATPPSLRLWLVAHPDTAPTVVMAPPPHIFHVNTQCGAISTSMQAPTHPTHASSTPADARDIHSRSLSSRERLVRPAKTAS